MIGGPSIPDLVTRSGPAATILSRTLRTWGLAESTLAELLAGRLAALDRAAADGRPAPPSPSWPVESRESRSGSRPRPAPPRQPPTCVGSEEGAIRGLLGAAVFGADDENMEAAVGSLLVKRDLTLAVAESLTGRFGRQPAHCCGRGRATGSGAPWSYTPRRPSGSCSAVGDGPVVSETAAIEMAAGAASTLGSRRRAGVDRCGRPNRAGRPAGRHRLGRGWPGWGPLRPGCFTWPGTGSRSGRSPPFLLSTCFAAGSWRDRGRRFEPAVRGRVVAAVADRPAAHPGPAGSARPEVDNRGSMARHRSASSARWLRKSV